MVSMIIKQFYISMYIAVGICSILSISCSSEPIIEEPMRNILTVTRTNQEHGFRICES